MAGGRIVKEIIAFLCGEGELYGCSFSEKPEGEKENFWWRKHLRHARDVQAHNLEKLQRENEGLRAERDELKALADERKQFIVNAVEFGYCSLPDESTNDPATATFDRCLLTDSYAASELQVKAAKKAFWSGFELSKSFPDRYDISAFWNEYEEDNNLRKGSSESEGVAK